MTVDPDRRALLSSRGLRRGEHDFDAQLQKISAQPGFIAALD